MSFADALQTRLNVLRKKGADVPELIRKNQRTAILAAVETATDLTPPVKDSSAGTGALTGEAKQHWATDSITEPDVNGNEFKVVLGNNKEYISYLNDGHRMDQHFVPGLIVNPHSGELERVDPSVGGIMVGTKTQYVPGLFMKEAAIEKYQETMLDGMEQELERVFNE